MGLSLETRVIEDVTVIFCKGRIAYGIEAASVSGEIAELVSQTRRVVIDLSGVEMIQNVLLLSWVQLRKVNVLAPTLDSCLAVYAPLTPYFCDGK